MVDRNELIDHLKTKMRELEKQGINISIMGSLIKTIEEHFGHIATVIMTLIELGAWYDSLSVSLGENDEFNKYIYKVLGDLNSEENYVKED